MYHLSFYRCYESKMFCSCGVKLEELFWILAQQQQHSHVVKSFSETKSFSWWRLADVLAFKYLTLILAWSCLILLSTIRDFVWLSSYSGDFSLIKSVNILPFSACFLDENYQIYVLYHSLIWHFRKIMIFHQNHKWTQDLNVFICFRLMAL